MSYLILILMNATQDIADYKNKQHEKKQIHDIAGRFGNTKHNFILHRESISIF